MKLIYLIVREKEKGSISSKNCSCVSIYYNSVNVICCLISAGHGGDKDSQLPRHESRHEVCDRPRSVVTESSGEQGYITADVFNMMSVCVCILMYIHVWNTPFQIKCIISIYMYKVKKVTCLAFYFVSLFVCMSVFGILYFVLVIYCVMQINPLSI